MTNTSPDVTATSHSFIVARGPVESVVFWLCPSVPLSLCCAENLERLIGVPVCCESNYCDGTEWQYLK